MDSAGIQCGFKRLPSYLYTECGEGMKKLEQERSAAVRAGIPASIVYDTGLPFPVKMALRYENQAQFDPIGFLYGLSDSLKICQYTRVLQVKGHEIRTDRGTVKADHIVFASHFPFPRWPGFLLSQDAPGKKLCTGSGNRGLGLGGNVLWDRSGMDFPPECR